MKKKDADKRKFQIISKAEGRIIIGLLVFLVILNAVIGTTTAQQKEDIRDKVGSMHAYLHQKDSQYQSFEDAYYKEKAAERDLRKLI